MTPWERSALAARLVAGGWLPVAGFWRRFWMKYFPETGVKLEIDKLGAFAGP